MAHLFTRSMVFRNFVSAASIAFPCRSSACFLGFSDGTILKRPLCSVRPSPCIFLKPRVSCLNTSPCVLNASGISFATSASKAVSRPAPAGANPLAAHVVPGNDRIRVRGSSRPSHVGTSSEVQFRTEVEGPATVFGAPQEAAAKSQICKLPFVSF